RGTARRVARSVGGVVGEPFYGAGSARRGEAVSVYVTQGAAADPAGVKALSGKILSSLAAGTGTLPRAGGKTRIVAIDDARDLFAGLPRDVVVSLQRGPDFEVARLHPLRALGQDDATLGIYVGHHPSFEERAGAKTRADKVLGSDGRWRLGEENGRKTAEALVRVPRAKDRDLATMAHLFANAPDEARLDTLCALARSLTVETR